MAKADGASIVGGATTIMHQVLGAVYLVGGASLLAMAIYVLCLNSLVGRTR